MGKLTLNRRQEDRSSDRVSDRETRAEKKQAKLAIAPVRRYNDHVQSAQLLWSFAVGLFLILAALFQWTSPKNALMEQDRSPAQIRLDFSSQGS